MCVFVRGRDLECDKVKLSKTCWNSKSNLVDKNFWLCEIKDQTIYIHNILNNK